jgi:hypothetical protein
MVELKHAAARARLNVLPFFGALSWHRHNEGGTAAMVLSSSDARDNGLHSRAKPHDLR